MLISGLASEYWEENRAELSIKNCSSVDIAEEPCRVSLLSLSLRHLFRFFLLLINSRTLRIFQPSVSGTVPLVVGHGDGFDLASLFVYDIG